METQTLKEIGLSDNEIRIYVELLKQEEALASELADATKVNRTLTYQILNNLLKRGLISYFIKNNIKYFKEASPNKILDFWKEKENNIQQLIPELFKLVKTEKKSYSVELYEGKEGLKTIINDIIRTKPKEWLDFTAGLTTEILPDYFMENWERKRLKAKIKAKFLVNQTQEGLKRGKELSKLNLSEIKYLPKGFEIPSHIYIYGDKVAITLWTKDLPFGVLIKSREIADRFKEFFEWFWKLASS